MNSRTSLLALALVSLTALATACGSSLMGGGSSESTQDSSETKGIFGSGQGFGNAQDLKQKVIKNCLAQWGNHPFSAQDIKNARVIAASVSVQGQGVGIQDTAATSKPELVFIAAQVNVLGAQTYKLLNPNGWYCLQTSVNVFAKTKVELACKAKLSDGKVAVNVGSQPSGELGDVGVHVGSEVVVKKVDCGSAGYVEY